MDERLWLGAICMAGLIWLVGMIASWRVPGSTVDKPAPVGKKERVLRPRMPDDCGVCRAEAGPTVVIPVLCLGGRTQAMAPVVIHGLCQCLMPGCIPLFTPPEM